jgi:translation initiation factor IF-3
MTRINDRIRAPRVRVVSADGTQLGVMNTREAVEKAKALGLDLVEVTGSVDPPVCRVVDYGKWKYEQAKLKKNNKVKTSTRMKEIKFRPRTEAHDYNVKMGRSETFLSEGHKLRIVLQFRGRENAHREVGFEVMVRIKEDLKTMAHVDQDARLSGRMLVMVLSPLPKAQQQRHFILNHGELIEEDDFDDDEDFDEEEEGSKEEAKSSEESPEHKEEAKSSEESPEKGASDAKE